MLIIFIIEGEEMKRVSGRREMWGEGREIKINHSPKDSKITLNSAVKTIVKIIPTSIINPAFVSCIPY